MKFAFYDLSVNPPGYDFNTFMQYALDAGAEHIVFGKGFNQHSDYLGPEGEKKRMETVVLPIIRLFGITYEFMERRPKGAVYPGPVAHRSHDFNSERLNKLSRPYVAKPTQQALDEVNDEFKGKNPIVVVMRACPYQQARNSSIDWLTWAEDHDAFVVRDWFDNPITIDKRFAYYERASLIMGVNCGAMSVNLLSYRPYIAMKMFTPGTKGGEKKAYYRCGWDIGSQMPWADKRQVIVWNNSDSYEAIEEQYQLYMKANG